ncbi:uncharacterized mitochondrial protein AtMg00860-like [Spinacia oleracea]|uniref:Uncharacterized mitochondrial protein AtMg00860-like n=1 Tax=Spinacia oleracea TaxID=3562 RepID=A0ABM3RHT9_SPIOL|nr:uncharacterized mitochondrial protein AtMg00860-like [Spinacia oleracea]
MVYLGPETFKRAYDIGVDIEDEQNNEVGADIKEDPYNDDQLSDDPASELEELRLMCEFLLEKVAFLGHYVSKEGVSVDPAKIQAMSEWPTPKNVSGIRSFQGLAGYYKRFARDFSKTARPMTNQMKKESKFEWSEKCEEALQI